MTTLRVLTSEDHPDAVVIPLRVPCDGSYTCPCDDCKRERAFLKPLATWLGIGLAISAASFVYRLHQMRDLPSVSPELRAQYVTAFAEAM